MMNEIEHVNPNPTVIPEAEIPDRVSIKPDDPFFDERYQNMVVIFEGGIRKNDVHEFCISEGWIKKIIYMANGKPIYERGKVRTIKMHGNVEVMWGK